MYESQAEYKEFVGVTRAGMPKQRPGEKLRVLGLGQQRQSRRRGGRSELCANP